MTVLVERLEPGPARAVPTTLFRRHRTATRLLGVTLGWQAVMTLLGAWLGRRDPTSVGLLGHTLHWDSYWYLDLLHGGYATKPGAGAFYPLFPAAVWLVRAITGGELGYPGAGLVVNTVAFWLALVALHRIATRLFGADTGAAWRACALLLTAPGAFFCHVFYSDALFCALAFWATAFALERRWAAASLVTAFATAARLPGLLVMLFVALEFAHSQRWRPSALRHRDAPWLLFMPMGLLIYADFLGWVRHDPLAMLHAYREVRDWPYLRFDPDIPHTLFSQTRMLVQVPGHWDLTNVAIPLFCLAVLAAASVHCLRDGSRRLLPLGLTGLAAIVMFTLNSTLISDQRYVLSCLPSYLVLASTTDSVSRHRWVFWVGCAAGLAAQVFLFTRFTGQRFAG